MTFVAIAGRSGCRAGTTNAARRAAGTRAAARWFALAVAVLLLAVGPARAQQWRFVVMGDDRSATRPIDGIGSGVNGAELSRMAGAVAAIKPDFVLFTGDLAFGYTSKRRTFAAGLDQWYAAMKPVFDVGIPVYPVRGNHDAACPDSAVLWRQFLYRHRLSISRNGPEAESRLTYYFDHKNARVIGLDVYQGGSFSGTASEASRQFPHLANNRWLQGLPKVQAGTHVFAFAHEMPFRVGSHADCLNSNATARDQTMELLYGMGLRVFFAGHDHDYDVVTATDPNDCTGKTSVLQVVAGTAGAPFYPVVNRSGNSWPLVAHAHWASTYGYLVVTVNGPAVTIKFFGRDTTTMPAEAAYTEKQRITYAVSHGPVTFTFTPDRSGNVDVDTGAPK